MVRALRAFWTAIRDIVDEFAVMALANVLWLLIAGPLLVVAVALLLANRPLIAVLAGLAAIVPLAPASAALQSLSARVSEGRAISAGLFFREMRARARDAWQLYVPWTIGLFLILFNLRFYASVSGLLGQFLWTLLIYMLGIWAGVLMYAGPLLIRQQDRRLRTLARNAFLLVFSRPIVTLVALIMIAALLVVSYLSVILPCFLTVALLAQYSQRVTDLLLEEERARRERLEQAATPPEPEKGRRGQVRPRGE